MAAIFRDSFDHYLSTDLAAKWTQLYVNGSAPGVGTPARTGPHALQCAAGGSGGGSVSGVALGVASYSTYIVGFALHLANTASTRLLYFIDTATIQAWLQVNANGSLSIFGNGVSLGTTIAGLIQTGIWAYIEVKVKVSGGGAGTYEVHVNSIQRLVGSGTTQASANPFANLIAVGDLVFSGQTVSMDDLYINDDQGANHNTFEGDVQIVVMYPTADGTHLDWTPDSGVPHFTRVNEGFEDGDTSYVAATAVGNIDSYTFGPPVTLPAAGAIADVQAVAWSREDAAGSPQVDHLVRISGVDYLAGDPKAAPASYVGLRHIWPVSPATGNPWTLAEVNAMEAGPKRTV